MGEFYIYIPAASTTQIFDVAKNKWSGKIAEGLGLSRSLFPRVVNTGSIKGEISDAVRREIGMPEDERLVVVASPAHDSAAAAFGVPAMTGNYMFINSGTWSVLGMVRDASFCSYIANATGKTVYAGPVEATAIGNAFVQLKSLGLPFDDRERARLLTESFDIRVYQPENQAEWDKMFCCYRQVIR